MGLIQIDDVGRLAEVIDAERIRAVARCRSAAAEGLAQILTLGLPPLVQESRVAMP
jgi:hypothetical protein